MKKFKIKEKKFLRNIIIVIISLIIIEKIIDIAPGYKRDKQTSTPKLIINEEIIEELKYPIYISSNKTVYLSKEDIQKYFDETIYYDEKYRQIITTSSTKVANIKINETSMTVNESNVSLFEGVILKNDIIYIPISEMELIYNLEIKYIEDNNVVIIDNLDKGMIVANASEGTQIKYKPRGLSKDIGELSAGTKVFCFYTTSKGWRKIRTEDGLLGYIKANKLTNEYILRQDMNSEINAKEIKKANKDEVFIADNEETVIKSLTDSGIDEVKSKYNVWIEVSNQDIEKQIKEIFQDYILRTQLIDSLVNVGITNKIQGIVINYTKMQNNANDFERFIIELAPKLREVGIKTCIKTNNELNKEELKKHLDYIM